MKQVSFVLEQVNDVKFYLHGNFEFNGTLQEAVSELSKQIVGYMTRVKRFKRKTNFKFGKKFTINFTIDGKTYRSSDLYFSFNDSGEDCRGELTMGEKRTAVFEDMISFMAEL